jgi:hypothetical protein
LTKNQGNSGTEFRTHVTAIRDSVVRLSQIKVVALEAFQIQASRKATCSTGRKISFCTSRLSPSSAAVELKSLLKVSQVKRETIMLIRLFLILSISATLCWSGAEAADRWKSIMDENLGFSFSYPETLFSSVPGDDKPSFHYFASTQSQAKFLVGGWDNRFGAKPEHFKRWMMTNAEGYEDVTYQPHGRSWFVLSGYRGDQIYYEKAIFSCDNHVVNVLAISYSVAQREIFDPVVERMEDNFKPGHECRATQ